MSGTTGPHGPTSRPARKRGLAVVELDGEAVVYTPDSDALHRLDRTASLVWSLLTGETTLATLAHQLAALDGAAPAHVLGYLTDLAETLGRRGLLDGSVAAPEFTGRDPKAPRNDPVIDAPAVVDGPVPSAPHRTRSCRALAHRFTAASNDIEVRTYLDYVLTDLNESPADSDASYEVLALDHGHYVLRYDEECIASVDRLDRALSLLLWHINTEAVRSADARYPVVHAAAAVRQGVTVLLPAPPESGKTTTVGGLVRAGFGYLTDEAVAIDSNSLLPRPYPKALSIDSGSWDVLSDLRPPHSDRMVGQWHVPATSVRLDAVADPAPIRFVVIPRYDPRAATELEPATRAEMLVALADSTFHFWNAPQRNLDVLARMLRSASCYRLTLSDLDDGVRLIDELMASEQLDVAE